MKTFKSNPLLIGIGLFATMCLCFGIALNALFTGLEEAGGVKSVLIEFGKEVKDITTEVEAYQPTTNN